MPHNPEVERELQDPNISHPEQPERRCGCVTNVYCEEKGGNKSCHCCCPKEPETCTFEIYMTRCKVTNLVAGIGKQQLMITGYANGRSAVVPGNGVWLEIHEKWGWRTINKQITSIDVAKGTIRTVVVMADVIEADTFGGGNWEMGSGIGSPLVLTLRCGQQTGATYVQVATHKVQDVSAGTTTAQVDIEFMAFQVTP